MRKVLLTALLLPFANGCTRACDDTWMVDGVPTWDVFLQWPPVL